MNEDEKFLLAKAELGEQARHFIESDIYRYMVGLAQQELEAADMELEAVSPEDKAKIMELQVSARTARSFKSRLDDLVHDGDEALEIWKSQQRKEP